MKSFPVFIGALNCLSVQSLALLSGRPRSACTRTLVRRHNVWSNAQAVEDYQDYLNGIAMVETTDTEAIIICGAGEREQNLAKCLARLNPRGLDSVIGLGSPIPMEHPNEPGLCDFPIYLCVSAAELEAAIDSAPEAKRDDLVFLSDGFLEPVLKMRSLCNKQNTQAVLWFNANDKGVACDGRTSMGPNGNGIEEFAGETSATGKWAGALKDRLGFGDVFCKVQFYRDWRRQMLERVAYVAVMNLVGSLHPEKDANGNVLGPCSHKTVANYFSDEVEEMVDEVNYTLRGYMAVTLLLGALQRICAYGSAHGGDIPALVVPESFKWTNGLFWENARLAKERGFPDTCAMHTEYCMYGAENGLFELPP